MFFYLFEYVAGIIFPEHSNELEKQFQTNKIELIFFTLLHLASSDKP